MVNVELRFVSNGRDVSFDEFADVFAERLASRIGREIRQHQEAVLRDARREERAASQLEPKAVSVTEAAQLLSVSVGAVRKFIAVGRLRAVHVGRRVLVPMEAIHRALKDGIPAGLE